VPTLYEQPHVIARLLDASGSRAELRVHIKREAATAAAKAAAAALLGLANAASDCVGVGWQLRYPQRLTGQPGPAGGGRTSYVGTLVFRTATPEQFGLVDIPGIIIESIKIDDPSELDIAHPAIAALISAIIAGGYTNPFGYVLTECIGALFEIRR
jgi:hypothetical protein